MRTLYFENSNLIRTIYEVCECIDRQDDIGAIDRISAITRGLAYVLSRAIENQPYFEQASIDIDGEYIFETLNETFEVQKAEDYILYGDFLKMRILPILLAIQDGIKINEGFFYDTDLWDENMRKLQKKDAVLYEKMLHCEEIHEASPYGKDVYSVEQSLVGDFSMLIKDAQKQITMHSNENPLGEAGKLIDSIYNVSKESYIIYGLGLGYHCKCLAVKDSDMKLTIIENDIGIIQLAMSYTNMDWYFGHAGVSLIYDEDWSGFSKAIDANKEGILLVHRPSAKRIKDQIVYNKIQEILVHEGSIKVYENTMLQNYRQNLKNHDENIDALQETFTDKRVVIVAGGPSLDQNVELLRNKPKDVLILSTGTVLKKLLDMGILVDYVIITDPKPYTEGQINGIEDCKVPLLLLSTTTKGIAKKYIAKKYLICQKGFEAAEAYAKENGLNTYETGGSVMTTALDVCIRFQVKSIIFIGLDLAFTGKKVHAENTREENLVDFDSMIQVDDVTGGKVPTSRPFYMYRKWIEARLEKEDVTMDVYDATEGGALIKGCILTKLNEVL